MVLIAHTGNLTSTPSSIFWKETNFQFFKFLFNTYKLPTTRAKIVERVKIDTPNPNI